MNYDALMAFAVFARHMNFTHAAGELFISQPALHQKITKLAAELDVPLYIKNGRELVLTEQGEMLATHAREVASLTEGTLARMRDSNTGGTVSIATGPGAFQHLIGPMIPEIRQGPYDLRLLTMRGREAAAAVREARVHVAVGVYENRDEGLERFPIVEVNQMVVMPEDHRLADRETLAPSDLAGESLVAPPAGHPNRKTTERVMEGFAWQSSVEALGYELAVQFVGYGMGVTILNDFFDVPEGMVGVPIAGFPTVVMEAAIREGTSHEGARWVAERLAKGAVRT